MCRWASACGRKPYLGREDTGNGNAGRGSAAAFGPTCFSPASGKRRNGSCRKESKVTGWAAPRGAARRCVFLLAASAVLLFAAGCYRATLPPKEEGAQPIAACGPSDASGTRVEEETAPSLPPPEPLATAGEAPSPAPYSPEPGMVPGEIYPPLSQQGGSKDEEAPVAGEATTVAAIPQTHPAAQGKANGKGISGRASDTGPATAVPHSEEDRGKTVVAMLSEEKAFPLRVRAWTSDVLSMIYPINDTIDYYLDVQTMVPLRQEFESSRKEDDVAIYDQEKGTIVYRYKKDGKVRKIVDAVPNVYDPVSVAYYFRTKDIGAEEKGRPMYAGRKLWEISAKPLGTERIRTERGEFDTIIIQPVLRREGKVEDKGNLRMWMSRDERHLPVRVYAKFKKIRTWTLVGELLPDPQGG